jgi:archaellum component FlaC
MVKRKTVKELEKYIDFELNSINDWIIVQEDIKNQIFTELEHIEKVLKNYHTLFNYIGIIFLIFWVFCVIILLGVIL